MAKMLALWWWIDRWRKSTAYTDMTVEEQGAYRNLIDEATLRDGLLPNDERVLAKACGDPRIWRRVRAVVLRYFTVTPEGLRNDTLEEVLHQSRLRAKKQADWRARDGNGAGNRSGNGSGNGSGNRAGNNPGYQDQDQQEQEPPKPPADAVGFKFTRAELRDAKADVHGYRAGQPAYVYSAHRVPGVEYPEPRTCPHEPQCGDEAVCVALFAQARRQSVALALAGAAS